MGPPCFYNASAEKKNDERTELAENCGVNYHQLLNENWLKTAVLIITNY